MTRWPVMALVVAAHLWSPARAEAQCPSMNVNDVLNDPRVQDALDQAWRDSMEGTAGEHEEGAYIQQCQNINAITGEATYFTQVLRWPHGDIDSSGGLYRPRQSESCRTVATFHTHPGPERGEPGADGYDNSIPSPEDYLNAANRGLPGIVRWGTGRQHPRFHLQLRHRRRRTARPGLGLPGQGTARSRPRRPAHADARRPLPTISWRSATSCSCSPTEISTSRSGCSPTKGRPRPPSPPASRCVTGATGWNGGWRGSS